MGPERQTPLDSFVDSRAPICYGILKPGPHQEDGIPVIKVKNIIDGRILEGELLRTTEEIHQQYKRSEVHAGDLLLTIRGSVGRLAIVPGSLTGANITQDTARIRVSSEDDPLYVFYALQSHQALRQMELNTIGQAVKGINIAEVRKLKLYHPVPSRQRKIAKILSTWDNAITTTEQLLAKSEQQKKALMQQLLPGKKRLPGFEGEWKEVTLGNIFNRVTNKNRGRSDNVVTISGRDGLIRQDVFFKKSVASETLDEYFLMEKGQFAYNKSYSNGYPMGAIKRLNRYDNGVVTTLYICFELADKQLVDGDFFEHFFESGQLNRGLTKIAHEGGRAHGLLNVKPADFFSLKVQVPETPEQKRIAKVLGLADSDIALMRKRLNSLKLEKKALMQQLLTGKRRVKIEEEAEAITA